MTSTHLTAHASTQAGDPTPHLGLVSVPLRALRIEGAKPQGPLGWYACAREASLALRQALEEFIGVGQIGQTHPRVVEFRKRGA